MFKRFVICVLFSTLLVVTIFSYSTNNIFAVPADKKWGTYASSCTTDEKTGKKTCCWRERVPGKILANTYCQTCDKYGKNCKEKVLQFTVPQITGESVLPGEGVLEQPPTYQRGNDANVPLNNGILEQPPTFQQFNEGGLLALLEEKQSDIQLFGDANIQNNDDSSSNLDGDKIGTNNNNVIKKKGGILSLMDEEDRELSTIETNDFNTNIKKFDDDNDVDKYSDDNNFPSLTKEKKLPIIKDGSNLKIQQQNEDVDINEVEEDDQESIQIPEEQIDKESKNIEDEQPQIQVD